MMTYKRYFQGHSFTLDKNKREERDQFMFKIPKSMNDYVSFMATQHKTTKQNILIKALVMLIESNDVAIIEQEGYDDSLNGHKSPEYLHEIFTKDWKLACL